MLSGVKSLLRLYGRRGIIDVVWGRIITEVIWETRDYWCLLMSVGKWLLRLYGRRGIIDVSGKMITEVIWEMRDYWCQWKNDYWGYMGDEGLLMSVEKWLLRLYGRRGIIGVVGEKYFVVVAVLEGGCVFVFCVFWLLFVLCFGFIFNLLHVLKTWEQYLSLFFFLLLLSPNSCRSCSKV